MAKSFDELCRNRKDLIEIHKKNNFTDGIHALLTDLYPDSAHFIYELLQNAEDMNATNVRFFLDKAGMRFEHNGTKRSFNIDDIDAITNIGHNSQKKDDPTAIGKFGVGFKAVFAYTATPIIHSGKYHFQIEDYFVPVSKGVSYMPTKDKAGEDWTIFVLPFNNPKKSAATAYDECLKGLNELDTSSLLFLQHIQKIDFIVESGKSGYIKRIDNGQTVSIGAKKLGASSSVDSRWLRFSKEVNIVDDQKKNKRLTISVAYKLEKDAKNKTEKIVPVPGGGKTFIYFPAEKEHSGLRFHINAPFASTVARDSVRDCSENKTVMREITQLIVDSLPVIKEMGLMNHAFFEVLPNKKDNLPLFYSTIYDRIRDAFYKNAYIPKRTDGFVNASDAMQGPASISKLFTGAEVHKLLGTNKKWIANANQRNSLADLFLQSLDLYQFGQEEFAQLFEAAKRKDTTNFIKEKDTDWLKQFYAVCEDVSESLDYSFVDNMMQTKMIRSKKVFFIHLIQSTFFHRKLRLFLNKRP